MEDTWVNQKQNGSHLSKPKTKADNLKETKLKKEYKADYLFSCIILKYLI